MSLSITNETKNSALTITADSKPSGGDFDDFPGRTFGDGGTFGEPATFISMESKNSLSISNETKT